MPEKTSLTHPEYNAGNWLKTVVVCPPVEEYFQVADLTKHNITAVSDQGEAIGQHAVLVQLLALEGARILTLQELPGHPNSVFTMDTAVAVPGGFIRARMGLPSRRNEEEWIASYLLSQGFPCMGEINDPGTLEGGDVIIAGSTAFIGLSTRTNKEGADQIADILSTKFNIKTRFVQVPAPSLHLGGSMTMIGPNKLIYCHERIPISTFANTAIEAIPIPFSDFISGNVINLGNNHVIADIRNIETIRILREIGIIVHPIDLSEFIKGTGGPSCLTMFLEREAVNLRN